MGDPWEIASVHADPATEERELAWREVGRSTPSRWLRSGSGLAANAIRVPDGAEQVFINLPAELRAIETIEQCEFEISIRIVRDDTGAEPRAVVDDVQVTRLGRLGVSSVILRGLHLGELVDWALTRAPVSERTGDEGDYLGPGHRAAAAALRASRRRTGKRGPDVVDPDDVARVARDAPPRGQGRALRKAFPNVARSTLQNALRTARERDPRLHSTRSRKASLRH